MVSLRDILPFSTKVCVMKRVRSDGSVELYCERPTKANASRDECIECLPVEECQEIYGLDQIPVFATSKREYYTVDGQLYSRPAQEPARSSQSSNSSSSSRDRNHDSRRSHHSRSTAPVLRPGNHFTDSSTRISNAGNNRHTERHSSRLSNNGFILNGNGNTINFHNNRTHLNYSGNATSSYHESRRYNTHSASQDRRPSPDVEQRTRDYSPPREGIRERSDFSAAEQAAWEERQWRKLQEEDRARSPSPNSDYEDDRDEREERPRSRRRQRSDSIEVLDSRFIYAGSGEFQGGDWIYATQREYSADGGFVYVGEGHYDSDGREYSR
ncbi:hypothetical protein K4K56_012119 [Colletotrichum sp. SAR 10_98]|nr:hypothetical protein K4K56_012119 [Colletotrichum sp. SAR 10_98]